MRVSKRSRRSEQGHTLLVACLTMIIIGLALVTYLELQTNANQLVVRSQVWNACLPVAEAGIEEALEHCSYNPSNLLSSGWSLVGNRYYRTNTVGEGFVVVNLSTNAPHDIVAIGSYPMPGTAAYVSRTVKVTTAAVPVFKLAMLSKTTVYMNGNKIRIDSYDSGDPAKSTNGRYDAAKAGDKADVGCMTGQSGPFNIGNGDLWGHAIVGAGGTVNSGPNGHVGSVAWQTSGKGVQPGWMRTDLNTSIPDVSPPFTTPTANPLAATTVDGVLYDTILTNGNYVVANLDKKVAVLGNATVYVTGSINSQAIYVRTNASAKIYCAGPSAAFNAVNVPLAESLIFFGLPSNKSIFLGSDWMGAVYAPNADFQMAGGAQLYGSVTANGITLKGSSEFHYDEALGKPAPHRGFAVTSWTEL